MSNFIKINRLLFFIFAAIISSAICFAQPLTNQNNFDVCYYEINISIDPQNETIDGSVTVKATSTSDNLSQLILDLSHKMSVTSTIGNSAGFIHDNDLLTINLDRSYNKDEQISVTIFYNGKPSLDTGFNPMTFDRSRGVVTISSESCPYYARYWWPCKDRPDDKPDSMDVKITVPADLTVASNGALIELKNNEDGTKTHHWQIRNPIATYLVSFTISNYDVIEDKYVNSDLDTLSIMLFIYPEHYNMALIDFNNVNEMLRILELYYGKYPYYNEKYGVAEYVGYWGGMEYQTLVSVQPYCITGNHKYDDLFVHEMAHQWWGDCVTPKNFHHSWISEGFAVFSEALYFGHLEGQETYHSYMNNENNALDIKGIMYRHDISNPNTVYASIVYNKGAWVLHMLRHVVGEENFWTGLQQYRSQFEYGSATTEDLQHAFEKVVGDSLSWFFHQWVYEPNYPHYAWGWRQQELGGGQYKLIAFIDQVQTDAPLFKMPLDLTITTASSETTLVKMFSDSLETFEYTVSEPIINFQLDKDNWVLKKKTAITSPSIEYVTHQLIDSLENNNGLAEPGETVELWVTLGNNGVLAQNSKAELASNDPDIQIISSEINFGDMDHAQSLQNSSPPCSFSVAPGAIGHITTFQINITANNDYATIDSFNLAIGIPTILLIDDDAGADYEQYFHQPMSLAKIYSDTWEVNSQGIPSFAKVLQNYQTVIWFTGDDRSNSLTSDEQQAISEYLDNGGWLVVTGQNIGYDLIADGTTEDSSFFVNYLHADYLADTVKSTMIRGESGDPIANGMFIYLEDRPGCAGNQTAPSAIIPDDGASSILKYIPQNSTAGIRYRDEDKGYRLVYLAFGFEGISGPYQDTAQKFLNRIINWLSTATEVKQLEYNNVPKEYKLEQNYPNPFNPTTKIKFQLPKEDHVVLTIYNMKGQKIKTLIASKQSAGFYEVVWDGTNRFGSQVASGLYVYRLLTNGFASSKKLILLK